VQKYILGTTFSSAQFLMKERNPLLIHDFATDLFQILQNMTFLCRK